MTDATATLAAVLTEYGPLSDDDIAARLEELGIADPEVLLDEVLDEIWSPVRQLLDDRWVWLPALLAGRVFTHRVSAVEVDHDVLTVTPDLDPITALCEYEHGVVLADGSPVCVALPGVDGEFLVQRGVSPESVDEGGVLVLPSGTLRGLGVGGGDLVGLQLSSRGLEIERVTDTWQHDIGERVASLLDPDEPVRIDPVVWTLCAADPAVFGRPLPPLSEIIDQHGLQRSGERLAASGFDMDSWRFDLDCQGLATLYGIDSDDAFALQTLVMVCRQMSMVLDAASEVEPLDREARDLNDGGDAGETVPPAGGYRDLIATVGAELADPVLAELLLVEVMADGLSGAPALGLFAEMLEPWVPRSARVGCRWLRAMALERLGDVEDAERELLVAESMDTDWPLTLFDLARFASDRGDVERGLALLRRAGADADHPLMRLLRQHRAETRHNLGRNQPCWCGSGRKYKKCHLGQEHLPLADRVNWLYEKAVGHALLGGYGHLLAELRYVRSRHLEAHGVTPDPLLIDAVLCEGGAFEEFHQLRGALLPDDERRLAERWLQVQRSVFEIEHVNPGRGISVRDVRTGDTYEVTERTASDQLKSGQLVCSRVLPADDTTTVFFGGIEPVELHERSALIELLDSEPDPVDVVAFLSRRFAPPTLTNTEGEPLVICQATVNVSVPAAVQAAFDDTYYRIEGDEPPCWHELVTTRDTPRIRITLVLDGATLRVNTNSENRMDHVLATLARLDPAMDVVDDVRRRLHDTRDVVEVESRIPETDVDDLDPDNPQLAAALDEFIRGYEQQWLDEPIPALDEYTPRQAANDPTRRADLVRLLDSFPTVAGGMDADRLRSALGLQ